MTTYAGLTLVKATITARLTIWALAGYSIWQGLGVIAGGPRRWTGQSFAVLRTVPDPTVTWGLLLVLFGLAVMAASLFGWWWLKAAGLAGIAVWSLMFAAGSFYAVSVNSNVANTGGKTYVLIAVTATILIFIDERRVRG